MAFIELLGLGYMLPGKQHDRWFLHSFDRFIEFGRDGTVAELQHAA